MKVTDCARTTPSLQGGIVTKADWFWPADLLMLAFFCVCLLPVSIGAVSINYLFVLYPVWRLTTGSKFRWPPQFLLWILGYYCLAYVAGVAVGLFEEDGIHLRSTSSFLIFVSVFAMILIDIHPRDLCIFKRAVILMAICFSVVAFIHFFLAGGNAVGEAQKDIVGSQRYGFVYLMAFCILFSKSSSFRMPLRFKATTLAIILAGMLLTFSRSTIIAFMVGTGLYIAATTIKQRHHLRNAMRELAGRIGFVLGTLSVLVFLLPYPFKFYSNKILSRYLPVIAYSVATEPSQAEPLQPPEIVEDVFNPRSSEGTRLVLWSLTFDYVTEHPILGSRYLGIWALENVPSGSAHNQLMDVLLRTGWLGLALYLVLLVQVLFCLYRKDRGLFWGLVTILIFGMFHETFKESQGAFILAFLVGILATTFRGGEFPGQAKALASGHANSAGEPRAKAAFSIPAVLNDAMTGKVGR